MKQIATIDGTLFTAYPNFRRELPRILESVLSMKDVYVPDTIEFDSSGKRQVLPFQSSKRFEVAKEWASMPFDSMLTFRKRQSADYEMRIGNSLANFNFFGLSVERDYFDELDRETKFLDLLVNIYEIIRPMYGKVSSREMVRQFDSPMGKIIPGIDLKRTLPDIFWANFFGPEYVDMFGRARVVSTPCHKVQMLSDGGALVLLSPSALDFLSDREGFEVARDRIKRHLGEDAFNKGWPEVQGKVPLFRYHDEWQTEFDRWKEDYNRKLSSTNQHDVLSRVSRNEWRQWIEENPKLALSFKTESKIDALSSDFSERDLTRIDQHIGRSGLRNDPPSIELVMKLGAYITQVITKHTGARWRFEDTDDLPSLMVGEVQIAPLTRTLKVLEEGEKFEPWYEAMNKLIVMHSPNKPANS